MKLMKPSKSLMPVWYMIGYGFLSVFEGIFILITFGTFSYALTLPYALWYATKKHKKLK